MDTTQVLLLGGIIFLILLAVGVFVATLTYWQRGQAKKQEAVRPQPMPIPEPESQEPDPSTLVDAPASPGEVMRVIRDGQTGRVLVEVEGQRYAHIREIQDSQVGRRVLWAIADLIRFTGGMATNPKAVRGALQPQEEAPTESTVGPTAGPAPTAQRQAPPLFKSSSLNSSLPLPPSRTTSPQRPGVLRTIPEEDAASQRYNIGAFFRRAFEPRPTLEPLPGPSSFIDEIEEILQEKIRTRPIPLPYNIHVQAGPDGALLIQVDQNTFSSPEEVPQAEVKELIRAAVAEWERR